MFKNINKKKAVCSLTFNAVIFAMMIAGLLIIIFKEKSGWTLFKWFTVQSNILMGIISGVYLILLCLVIANKKNKMPKAIEMIKLMTTNGVLLTFMVVLCFLMPNEIKQGHNPKFLFLNSSLFFHVLLPILSVLTWLLFEHSENKYFYPESLYSIIHVVLYGIFYIAMAFTHMKDGKFIEGYDWYGLISTFGVKWCPLVFIVMLGASYLMGWLLWLGSKKINLFPLQNNQKKKINKQ